MTAGHLYVVATPIGNLDDLTARAGQVLRDVDRICAEDTRTTRRLLAHIGAATPMTALHDHNEAAQAERWVADLQAGTSIALVSDAGTPLVSDPGYRLVRAARLAGVPVVPIPGASAVLAALSAAGLPTDRFRFEGFLPPKAVARANRIDTLAAEPATWVLFEAPHRVVDTVDALVAGLGGQRPAWLARELTKTFEEFIGPTLDEIARQLGARDGAVRGEIVLVIGGAPDAPTAATLDRDRLLAALLAELPASRAARVAATATGEPRNALYQRALALQKAD